MSTFPTEPTAIHAKESEDVPELCDECLFAYKTNSAFRQTIYVKRSPLRFITKTILIRNPKWKTDDMKNVQTRICGTQGHFNLVNYELFIIREFKVKVRGWEMKYV